MKGFFRFLVFSAVVAGVAYFVKQMLAPSGSDASRSGAGVLPTEPVKSLDDAPLGGPISD